jgi:hypothetical protein
MPNPINSLIPDTLYAQLDTLGLLNKKILRDLEIRVQYDRLRNCGIAASDAISEILEAYPYLQHDTVRKIIYSPRLSRIRNAFSSEPVAVN